MTVQAKQWWLASIGTVLIGVSIAVGYELWLRERGVVPTVIDDKALWSIHRDRSNDEDTLVLLGASRVQLGFDAQTLFERYPDCRLSNLVVNGTYPMTTLAALAADEAFSGVVLAGLDARAFSPKGWVMQADHSRYYDRDWRLERKLDRWWQLQLQRWRASANPDQQFWRVVTRAMDNRWPTGSYIRMDQHRLVAADYDKVDQAAHVKYRVDERWNSYQVYPPRPADQWIVDARRAAELARTIEARGGRVIFFRTPVSGGHWEADNTNYPRDQYWERWVAETGVDAIHFQNVPELATLNLPDTSHADDEDRPLFTNALLAAIESRFDIYGCQTSPTVEF